MAGSLSRSERRLAAADPVLAGLIERIGPKSLETRAARRGEAPGDAYAALLRTVIGQQLSTKAARTIYGRVLEIFDGRDPSPAQLLEAETETLRAAGLSGRKVEYLRDLARHVLDGELELDRLEELSDEEVIEEIVAIRGLGRWSAEMFLIFHLRRPDVFSGGDLGLRRAIQLAYGMSDPPTPDEAVELAERWRPERSLACIYLWESLAEPADPFAEDAA
jgi:DNA-3-methyladenine glycosylase II